jgi:hypothetical protein
LTIDSAASDRNPTDPVSNQAHAFSAIVATAAAIDRKTNRVNRLVA